MEQYSEIYPLTKDIFFLSWETSEICHIKGAEVFENQFGKSSNIRDRP
jgi:hypothetical protein